MADTTITQIYLLRDPRDGAVRYVGKTITSLRRRLSGHISRAKKPQHHSQRWIAGLLGLGFTPIIELIEIAAQDWQDRERFWIAHYRGAGARLTNLSDGGETPTGIVITDATRDRMSKSQKASYASDPVRLKKSGDRMRALVADPVWSVGQSARLRARWSSPAAREKQSEDTRVGLSDPAVRLKMSVAGVKRWTPERRTECAPERSENATKQWSDPVTKTRMKVALTAAWTPDRRAALAEVTRARSASMHAAKVAKASGHPPDLTVEAA